MAITCASRQALAILGGPKSVNIPAPAWPVVDEGDVARVAAAVRSGVWSWVGPNERAFCKAFAEFIGTPWCLALANGTVTLQCALQAVGVEPGHEVIVPGLTWVATAQAALDIGADVVLVDIDPETLCMDPEAVRKAITPRTRAIVPVHLYGCMCDMDAIMDLARSHGLKVVEDAAHQHGSRWRGVGAGAIGDAGSFSFQQSKVLTSGEGGAVTCRDRDVYETVFALKQVGWRPADCAADPFGGLVPGNRYGHNYRITEMQAALLLGGLERLPAQTEARELAAARLARGLAEMGGPLRAARRDPRVTRQAYYGLTLHYDAAAAGDLPRAVYRSALAAEGFPLNDPYWPVHRSPLLSLYDRTSPVPFREPGRLQDYASLCLPNTEAACAGRNLVLGQTHLLGNSEYIDALLAAVSKVNSSLAALRDAWRAGRLPS